MARKYIRIYLPLIVAISVLIVGFALKVPVLASIGFFGFFLFLFLINGKKSVLRETTIENVDKAGYIAIFVFMIITILVLILPMGLAPFWNGRIPMHRNQYELLADSILNGHIYLDYDDIDPKLLEMSNPYDTVERRRLEVSYHWDHAFYNGHYYMYFGVVPVFFLFIPFKLIFGKTLVTFHASQFFSMFSVVAFFLLFFLIARKFFKNISLGLYILLSMAVCFITIGYITQAPALYCTAIGGAIFFMLWSLCFYFIAVYYAKKEWAQVAFAVLGALCGALAFGCRPPVAIANLLAIPLAVTYAKGYQGKLAKLIRNFAIIAIPYIVVAGLLMAYNYARFENPLEFGQAYQLTSQDQTGYMSFFARLDIPRIITCIYQNLFSIPVFEKTFPFLFYGGFLVTYPLMWLLVVFLSKDKIHASIKEEKFYFFAIMLCIEPVICNIFDAFWAPNMCERYRLDEYFVLGILIFVLAGFRLRTTEKTNRTNSAVSLFAVLSILMAVLIFFYPNDANYTYAYPEKLTEIGHLLTFGLK